MKMERRTLQRAEETRTEQFAVENNIKKRNIMRRMEDERRGR